MDRAALSPLLRSFERHLRAENRSANTVESYLESVRQAEVYLTTHGRTLLDAQRGDLEAFLGELLTRRAPGTVATRYKVLRILYRWLEEEDEITTDPMARMKPPIIPEQPVPVVAEDSLRRLLAACAGKTFEARRDTAVIMFLLDTGARRAELAGLRLADLDFDLDVALVLGKGRRERALPFGRKTAVAWTATCALASGTRTPTCRGCGLGSAASSPPAACSSCSGAEVRRPGCPACMPISCGIPSPTSGSPRAGARPT
jgi:site-specific recombinase XerD